MAGLDVAAGLEATLFASEPMVLSPTNIDVDHRGRVWVCEIVNYRGHRKRRPAGDRVLILEDSSGDGRADRSTVFYQGVDINGAMGICVLGNRVIVTASPNVFVLTDEDGDDKADKKEVLFSKTGDLQSDHAAHAFVFGPDGKLYWNFGNAGHHVHDAQGKLVVDQAGNAVTAGGKPYREGMVFRCNLDGSQLETLGWNFRNNYEVAIDSFGNLWQSDNDDDGNRAVRINFVMEFGNYGYKDERTGAGWQTPRTGMHPEVPLRHFYQNDPGVVPNLLQTGAGAPTGICVYEGDLLPESYRDALIHADSGVNVVRAYPTAKDGAGYRATMTNLLEGVRDKWFRPVDVAVAPDGALLVADWYDPGVGGHQMGDLGRGRVFRVAPSGQRPNVPKFDFTTARGAIEALKSPNLDARYLAWTSLRAMGQEAEAGLENVLRSDPNPRIRARALWLLAKLEGRGRHHVQQAMRDADPDIRVVAIRAARQSQLDVIPLVEQLVRDSSPQVRRACAIALRHQTSPAAAKLWAELATQHDGRDRWYVEALGIAADGKWDACLEAWLAQVGETWNTATGRDIIWRSRASRTAEYLARIIADPSTSKEQLPRYFRAFDFLDGKEKQSALTRLALEPPHDDATRKNLILLEASKRLDGLDLSKQPEQAARLQQALDAMRDTAPFVQLVDQFNLASRFPELLAMAQRQPDEQIGVDAIRVLLAKNQGPLIAAVLNEGEPARAAPMVAALGNSADHRAVAHLLPIVKDAERDLELRRQSARALAKIHRGAWALLELQKQRLLDERLQAAVAVPLTTSPFSGVRQPAARLFPLPPAKDNRPLPPLRDLVAMRGDAQRGQRLFSDVGTCHKCHLVRGTGKAVGPDLSEIGSKLSRQALFESILYPSAGISPNYETYLIQLGTGNVVSGIVTSRTEQSTTVKSSDALVRTFAASEIAAIQKQDVSLMPADLQKVLTAQQLADLVEYLTTLKKSESR